MEIEIIFKDSATPKKLEVDGTYTKGGFFCMRIGGGILKYPMENIFSVFNMHQYHAGCKEHLVSLRGEKKGELELIKSAMEYDECGGDLLTFFMENSPDAPKNPDEVKDADIWFFIFTLAGSDPVKVINYLKERGWAE